MVSELNLVKVVRKYLTLHQSLDVAKVSLIILVLDENKLGIEITV